MLISIRRRGIRCWVVRGGLIRCIYFRRILLLQTMVDKILRLKVLRSVDIINPSMDFCSFAA
jgi:hypothetical protein